MNNYEQNLQNIKEAFENGEISQEEIESYYRDEEDILDDIVTMLV